MSESGEKTAQMELDLPRGLVGLYGFAWPGTPKWRMLNREEVLVPIIDGPLNVRRYGSEFSSLLKAANTSVAALERKIQELFSNGIAFKKETCPTVFDDSITIEVFTSSPINMEVRGDIHGTGRLIVVSEGISCVGSDFPLIIITLGHTPNIKGWVWVKQPCPKIV